MNQRLTPLITLALSLLLAACASTPGTNSQWASGDSARDAVRLAAQLQVRDGPEMAPSAEPQFTVDSDELLAQADDTPTVAAERKPASLNPLASHHGSALPEIIALADADPTVNRLLARAEELIGTPYRSGGTTTRGFDCSGFVGYLFREEAGIELPRTTRELMAMGKKRVAKDELQPGDIILFNRNGRGHVSHTAIYIGDNKFIHAASHRSGGVRIDSLDERYWRKSYLTAKRVLD